MDDSDNIIPQDPMVADRRGSREDRRQEDKGGPSGIDRGDTKARRHRVGGVHVVARFSAVDEGCVPRAAHSA